MNLSGVVRKSDISYHKWMGVDGDGSHLNLAVAQADEQEGKTRFEPQRIRTYLLQY